MFRMPNLKLLSPISHSFFRKRNLVLHYSTNKSDTEILDGTVHFWNTTGAFMGAHWIVPQIPWNMHSPMIQRCCGGHRLASHAFRGSGKARLKPDVGPAWHDPPRAESCFNPRIRPSKLQWEISCRESLAFFRRKITTLIEKEIYINQNKEKWQIVLLM